MSDYTRKSRLVLYDNGAFVLQYDPILGKDGYRYRGQYQDANGITLIMLEFNGRRVGDPYGTRLALSKASRSRFSTTR